MAMRIRWWKKLGRADYYQPEYPNERWDVDSKDQDSSFPVISQADKDYEVFVSNLSYDVTEEELTSSPSCPSREETRH